MIQFQKFWAFWIGNGQTYLLGITLDQVQFTPKALEAKNPFWKNPKTIYSGAIIALNFKKSFVLRLLFNAKSISLW
jgi:hypothetical protein